MSIDLKKVRYIEYLPFVRHHAKHLRNTETNYFLAEFSKQSHGTALKSFVLHQENDANWEDTETNFINKSKVLFFWRQEQGR